MKIKAKREFEIAPSKIIFKNHKLGKVVFKVKMREAHYSDCIRKFLSPLRERQATSRKVDQGYEQLVCKAAHGNVPLKCEKVVNSTINWGSTKRCAEKIPYPISHM